MTDFDPKYASEHDFWMPKRPNGCEACKTKDTRIEELETQAAGQWRLGHIQGYRNRDAEVAALRERVQILEGAKDILREHNIRMDSRLFAIEQAVKKAGRLGLIGEHDCFLQLRAALSGEPAVNPWKDALLRLIAAQDDVNCADDVTIEAALNELMKAWEVARALAQQGERDG